MAKGGMVAVYPYNVAAEVAEDKLKRLDEPCFIMYDYSKRDALTRNAFYVQTKS
jgi:hypothetical protein